MAVSQKPQGSGEDLRNLVVHSCRGRNLIFTLPDVGVGCRPADPVFRELSESARIRPSLVVHMNRKAIVRVLADPVMAFPALPDRIDMYRDPAEMGHVME
jgi:hypothetical protein